jgi:hypothetical protein
MAYILKVQLNGVKPPVWRKVVVNENITFHNLHLVIQKSMGWLNYHMYQFSPSGYGSYPIIEEEPESADSGVFTQKAMKSAKTTLQKYYEEYGAKLTYTYDFGDDWNHSVILEETTDEKVMFAKCISAKGSCPPENCGGIYGYHNMLQTLNDPNDPEYEEMREWLGLMDGEEWKLNNVDIESINLMLKEIKSK